MDTIAIKGMQFHGKHGVAEHEKEYGNDFEVDVIISADLSQSAETDDLSHTFDYSRIHEISGAVLNGKSVDLIEKLVFQIGNNIEQEFPEAASFEVVVRKLNPPVQDKTKFTEVRMQWPRL